MASSAFFGAAGVGFGLQLGKVGKLLGMTKPGLANPQFTQTASGIELYGGVVFFTAADSLWKASTKFVQREFGRWTPVFYASLPTYQE